MNLFIRNTLFFILAILLGILVIIFIPASNLSKHTNLFCFPAKNETLANTPAPRIIFLGGSSMGFGLNSQLIKDSLKLNPINNGIHASIGLRYMLDNYLAYAQPNDVVVVAPEYQQFYSDVAEGDVALLTVLVDVLRLKSNCSTDQLWKLSKKLPKYALGKIRIGNYFKKIDTAAMRVVDIHSFNQYGDSYKHWTMPSEKNIAPYTIDGEFNHDALKYLIDFQQKAAQKNIRFFISFPCYQQKSFDLGKEKIKRVERVLKENNFTILGTPERYITPDSLIFNTPYHPTKKGVDIRTLHLIQDLKKADI